MQFIGLSRRASGALVMLAYRSSSGSRLAPLGWAGIALSNLIFIAVDGLAAGVLPRVAALEGAAAVFAGLKLAYDLAFIVGTLAFGLGGLALLSSEMLAPRPALPRVVLRVGLALSLAGLLGALLYFAGLNLAMVIGLAIGGGALIFIAYGVQLARSGQSLP